MLQSHPETRRTIAGDGLDLAAWERGDADAPTVVLVHGYPDTHEVWHGIVEELAERFHVVTYDVRGAGASDVPRDREGYDLGHLVADLAAVIDATSPDHPIHLVGHDWGSIQCWEAVTTSRLEGRIASYTSMSGPSLDHVGAWFRARLRPHRGDLAVLLRQAVHSWYIALFRLPLLAPMGWRTIVPPLFTKYLRRVEGVTTAHHPAPTLGPDGVHGVELYRRNVGSRLRRPQQRTTDVPVQLVVLTEDRYVTPSLLSDVGEFCSSFTRREAEAGHWVVASEPLRAAGWIEEHIASLDLDRA